MESLTLNDGRGFRRHAEHFHTKERRHQSPRLPTPEDSRTSNDAFDDRSPPHTRTQPPLSDRNGIIGIPADPLHSRRDSRNTAVPHSPPYHIMDGQKPSLPPLKTVLGDNMSSPPRTPSPNGTQMQPSPREPSYTASTYKPPALYPNKKARVEPSIHSAPPYPGFGNLSAPLPPTAALEPRTYSSSLRSSVQFPPLSAPIESITARRASATSHSPPWGTQHLPLSSKLSSPQSSFEAAASHYQTPEQTPTSSMLEPSFPKVNAFAGAVQDPFARGMRESFAQPGEQPASRRSSSTGYGLYPVRPYDREPTRPVSYQPQGPRYAVPLRDGYADPRETARYGRTDEHGRAGFGQGPYASSGPAFFMPSHYEYQHGKARKRSNLPKQSTEIMKTWFDQNIANPYPSEEQKAIFSNATGISMTQVSNWFINHRRRCPELRDKREKGRGVDS